MYRIYDLLHYSYWLRLQPLTNLLYQNNTMKISIGSKRPAYKSLMMVHNLFYPNKRLKRPVRFLSHIYAGVLSIILFTIHRAAVSHRYGTKGGRRITTVTTSTTKGQRQGAHQCQTARSTALSRQNGQRWVLIKRMDAWLPIEGWMFDLKIREIQSHYHNGRSHLVDYSFSY